jgi:hypothetical protein
MQNPGSDAGVFVWARVLRDLPVIPGRRTAANPESK